MPAHYSPCAGIALRSQVAPALTHQGQVGAVAYPHLVGARGRGLAQRPFLGYGGGRVGQRTTRAQRPSARFALSAGPQPGAQRVAPHLVAFGLQLSLQAAAGAIPPSMAGECLLRGDLPLVVAAATHAQHPAQISKRTSNCSRTDKHVLAHD